ncbi:MAG: hypothetical protein ABFS42_09505 [Candidatus Krumholzibacteriota bacterium]
MTRILFLCTGNTCRSPVAEVVSRRLFRELDLDFRSVGLDARSGQPASPESRAWTEAAGISLADHGSRPVSADILKGTSWVIGMTRSHAAIFRSRFGDAYAGSIGMLGDPGVDLGRSGYSGDAEEVPDPYGGSPENYALVCEQIARLCAAWGPCFRSLAVRKDLES